MKGFATATALLFLWICNIGLGASGVVINTPMTPPYWALLERELLKSQTVACERFFEKYFDQRGLSPMRGALGWTRVREK